MTSGLPPGASRVERGLSRPATAAFAPGATHFQAADRPADPCEQVWMDEDGRCAIRLNELLQSAPNVVQHLLSLSPCLTETFGR